MIPNHALYRVSGGRARPRSINSLSYDNLRIVNMRSAPSDPRPTTLARLVPWLVVAAVVVAGVVLAFRYAARVTPLIDGVR